MRRSLLGLGLGLSVLSGVAAAQSLPPDLVERAQALPVPTREELQRHAATLASMTPAQREAFARRVAEWDALVPAWQRERREAWLAWLALPVAERARVQATASTFAELPADRQQALRARFDALDGSDRHGWLLGPGLGADYPSLHALIAQVPAPQREALLTALRAMSPRTRANLAVLSQRTPPQERDALRTQLLAVPEAQRDAWLRERLAR